ncbi:MAG TPA: hypothetical protein VNO26_10065 [Candidatus Limnocylindria bacterium]|nr:hypothetical protein [Candidatus Limnocylindria bacterium]
MRPVIRALWAAGVAMALAAPGALASDERASDSDARRSQASTLPPGWRIDFVPYLWLSTVRGTSSMGGRSTSVDVGYDELFDLIGDHLSLLAGFAHLEVGHDRVFGFLDVAGTRIDTNESARLKGITVPDFPNLSTTAIDASVDLRLDSVIFEFGAGYRVLELALPNRARPFYLEALAGGRYIYFWTRVHATASTRIVGLPGGPRAIARAVAGGGDIDWVDPFMGGRFGVPLTDDILLSVRADIGGFGAGSDLAWSMVGGLQYAIPWTPVAGVRPWFALGYKLLSFDYQSGSLALDLTYQGPATAIGLSF